ncbi:MAG: pyridoxamine 5'-phosphate oxidase [Ignavibacteria bacterium]|nr:pyridoxamine 5'-phosphate oxidase [Ignavibacteria bacterium]
MALDIATLRKEYTRAELTIESVNREPLAQFLIWFDEALASNIHEPTAMVLASATLDAKPSSRVVLLKGVDNTGFVWYTNYHSRKGSELEANPHASLLFFWPELERQIRIEGTVERVSPEQSTQYFHSRPFESQVGAVASPQSQVVPSRDYLEQLFATTQAANAQAQQVEKPEHWGGYRLTPTVIEFWQGRASRMHDRIRYRMEQGVWVVERLAP